MKITNLRHGLAILNRYTNDVQLDYVPNGTPDHPRIDSTHFVVPIDDNEELLEADQESLRRLGWHSEQKGVYWCPRQSDANRASPL